jgi:hypothetical protein
MIISSLAVVYLIFSLFRRHRIPLLILMSKPKEQSRMPKAGQHHRAQREAQTQQILPTYSSLEDLTDLPPVSIAFDDGEKKKTSERLTTTPALLPTD